MKHRAILFLLFLSLPVLATGAIYQVKAGNIQISEPGFTVDVRYPLALGLGPQVDQAFNMASRNHVRTVVKTFEQNARQSIKDADGSRGDLTQSLNLDFETKHLSDRLLAILVSGSEFNGGAHPNPIFYTLLVNPKTGRKVDVASLFAAKSNYLSELSRLTAAELKPRIKDLNTEEKWVREGTAAKAENFQIMWPGHDGLYILFPPYAVAPYSSGAPHVVIPYSKLEGLLSNQFFDN